MEHDAALKASVLQGSMMVEGPWPPPGPGAGASFRTRPHGETGFLRPEASHGGQATNAISFLPTTLAL